MNPLNIPIGDYLRATPTAAKPHTCIECSGIVSRGEKYVRYLYSRKAPGKTLVHEVVRCLNCDNLAATIAGVYPSPSNYLEEVAVQSERRQGWFDEFNTIKQRRAYKPPKVFVLPKAPLAVPEPVIPTSTPTLSVREFAEPTPPPTQEGPNGSP